jgi:hypothetical protein
MEATDTPQLQLKDNAEAYRREVGLARLELMVTTVFDRLSSVDRMGAAGEAGPKAA